MGNVMTKLSVSLDGFVAGPVALERIRAVEAPGVTHLAFRVVK